MFITQYLTAKVDLAVKLAEVTGDHVTAINNLAAIKGEASKVFDDYVEALKKYAVHRKTTSTSYYIALSKNQDEWRNLYLHASDAYWTIKLEAK